MKKPDSHDRMTFGLWIYLMSDCVLFACLFAAYAVLHAQTAGAPSSMMLFDRPFVLIETLVLLASSFTCGLALLAARAKSAAGVWAALAVTFGLGVGFLVMEQHEFARFVAEGHGWQTSAFLSSFFTLVGTHGLHIFVGLLWLLALFLYMGIRDLSEQMTRRIFYFSLFWHFLDIVWICIFSLVYLLGSL